MNFVISSDEGLNNCVEAIVHKYKEEKAIYVVELKEWKKDRTYKQNKLYWAMVTELCIFIKANGYGEYEKEELHEYMIDMFHPHPVKVLTFGKREVTVRRSTTQLSTVEFMNYMEEINAWAYHKMGYTVHTYEENKSES